MPAWKCELEFIEPFVGKIPADPKSLKYMIEKRAKEAGKKLKAEEVEALTAVEMAEGGEVTEVMKNTFYKDEKGIYVKPFDIVGMLKERVRKLGLSLKKRGYIGALESLKVEPHRIYLMRKGKPVKRPDGEVVKPVRTLRGGVVTISDCVNPPASLSFTVQKEDWIIKDDEFEHLLKSCDRLGGLRKEYGLFRWISIKRVKP